MREPNPDAAGGLDRLRAEGVETAVGGDTENARVLNRRWLKWAQERRPWVTLKAAISMDGRIATRTGQSKWITGEAARHRSLELREEHDAILVGVETILADNPRLTRRLDMNPRGPWKRVILDSRLRTPSSAAAVQSDPDQTLIAHTAAADPGALAKLEEAGAQLLEVVADDSGLVDLHQLLEHLARRGIAALLVEGGARVHGSFVDSELVDEAVFFVAPLLIGGNAPSAVAGRGIADLDLASKFVFEHIDRHGEDLEVRAVRPGGAGVHRVD
jgi:diaminohydroxyphosphoribosylaminopyrimidine deaminase/5-amino-6-(5-phosphoribosylamino)uracil reductase